MGARKFITFNNKLEIEKSGIYRVINKETNEVYIGGTKRFSKRFKEHVSELQANGHHCKKLQESFNRNGIHSIEMEIIEIHLKYDKKYIWEREQFYIDQYLNDNKYILLNSSLKSHCGVMAWNENQKKEASLKYSGKGNPHFGKKHSEEKRKEISEKLIENHANNKEKWKNYYNEKKEKGLFHKAALKAWENPSSGQIENLNKLINISKNLTPEDLKKRKELRYNTMALKKGFVILYDQDKIIGKFRNNKEAGNFLNVSATAIFQAIKNSNKCQGFIVKKEKI